MSSVDTQYLDMPVRPGLIGSASKELLKALLGPMERVGMNPQQWFEVLAASRTDDLRTGEGV